MNFVIQTYKPGTDVVDAIYTLRNCDSTFALAYAKRLATGLRMWLDRVNGTRIL